MHLMCNMFAPLNNEDPLHKHEYFSFDRIIDNKLSAYKDYEIIFDWYTTEGMPKDEVLIEGFHLRNHPIVGVQWHPEEMSQIELLKEIFQ